MKKILFAVFMTLAFLPLRAGKVVTDSLSSKILGTVVKYNVYLPSDCNSAKLYPAVYLLHGLSDDYTAWVKRGNMQTVADELVRSGEARPMVIIMPNAGGPDTHNTWNGYFNMPDAVMRISFSGNSSLPWRRNTAAEAARAGVRSWACPWAVAVARYMPRGIRTCSPVATP